MRILFLTSRSPFPPLGGERLRAFHFIKALSRNHEVTLLTFVSNKDEIESLQPISKYVERYETILLNARRSYFNCVLGLFSQKPLQVHYYRSKKMSRALRKCLGEYPIDLIFVHLARMAEYSEVMNGVPKIMDLTDALSMSYERNAACESSHRLNALNLAQRIERRRIRQYETSVIERFDCNLLISPADRDYLSQFASADKIRIIGPGVNLDYFDYSDGPYDRNTIILVGKMSTFPNRDAALYFCREVFPLVLRQLPQMTLQIVGIEPGAEIRALQRHPNIEVTGYVPDIRPHLRQAALSICPMRTGAGAKNKVLESMAIGTPVVSTTLGIEGIDLQAEHHVLLGDSAAEFAQQIGRLVAHPGLRRKLARAGRKLVEERYGWELVLEQLNNLVDSFHGKG